MKKWFILMMTLLVFITTGCSDTKENIVIYTSMEEERIQEMQTAIKEEFPDYNIDVQQIATGNLAAKIKTEKENIEADIILDLETAHAENLKDNFADISDIDTSFYLDNVNPKDNKYLIWVKYYMGVVIDKDYFEEHNLEVPHTYEDLLKEEYKGLIAMPDPSTSGTGYGFYLNIVNLYGEDKALEYFEKLSENIKQYTTSGSGPVNLLNQKEIAIAMGMLFQGVDQINKGSNYELVMLDTGLPYNTTGSAIIKGKENKEHVKEVFSWLVKDFGYIDKAKYMPSGILVDEKCDIKNYPTNIKDADMTGIIDISVKEHLTEMWDK